MYLLFFLLQLQKYLSTDPESAELLMALDMAMVSTQSAARSVAAASRSSSDSPSGGPVVAADETEDADADGEKKKRKPKKPTAGRMKKPLKRQRVESTKDSPFINIGITTITHAITCREGHISSRC